MDEIVIYVGSIAGQRVARTPEQLAKLSVPCVSKNEAGEDVPGMTFLDTPEKIAQVFESGFQKQTVELVPELRGSHKMKAEECMWKVVPGEGYLFQPWRERLGYALACIRNWTFREGGDPVPITEEGLLNGLPAEASDLICDLIYAEVNQLRSPKSSLPLIRL